MPLRVTGSNPTCPTPTTSRGVRGTLPRATHRTMGDTLVVVVTHPSGVFGASSRRVLKTRLPFAKLLSELPEAKNLRNKHTVLSVDTTAKRDVRHKLASEILAKLETPGFEPLEETEPEGWYLSESCAVPQTLIEIHAAVLV